MYISYRCITIQMAFKCSKCGSVFEEKRRLEIHKQVHGRKSKIDEYGSPEFNQDRLRG
jgi:transcription initiation factor IIE alpha subunit